MPQPATSRSRNRLLAVFLGLVALGMYVDGALHLSHGL